jgi:hypothetical protein
MSTRKEKDPEEVKEVIRDEDAIDLAARLPPGLYVSFRR